MKWVAIGAAAAVALAAASGVGCADVTELKVGDKAPDFKLKGTDGKEYTLSQFHGKSAVVLAWYPRASTGG